jgi:hypothetical protein
MSRIQAYLGLDISGFQSGLDKAQRGADRFKQLLKAGDIKGGLKEALSAGAIIQGFRAVMQAAQDARDAAHKIGKEVDAGTASVARYADLWDKIKRSIGEASISGLSFFTRAGEAAGDFLNDRVLSKLRGMTPEQAKRTREVSEKAEANADRLEAGKPDAKKRGDERKKKIDEDRKKAREDLEKTRKEGSEQFEKNQFNALSLPDQIDALKKKRAEAIDRRGTAQFLPCRVGAAPFA